MKQIKLFIGGTVISTDTDLLANAQKAIDEVLGKGSAVVSITRPNSKDWTIRIDRTYPDSEQYEVPAIKTTSSESQIYFKDAFILAGNIGKEVINFGYMPFASYGYKYWLAENDFLYFWNEAAKKLGFTKLKGVSFVNDTDYFAVTMKYKES